VSFPSLTSDFLPAYGRGMTLILVNSSAIRAVGYDGYTLTVEFHTGRIYDHPHVPYDVYVGLMQASSRGAYYNAYVRGRYR
jgi:hypothetical protein